MNIQTLTRTEVLYLIERGYEKVNTVPGEYDEQLAVIALLMGLNQQDVTDDQCRALLHKHNIPADYMPPRILMRHALLLTKLLDLTIQRLEQATGTKVEWDILRQSAPNIVIRVEED